MLRRKSWLLFKFFDIFFSKQDIIFVCNYVGGDLVSFRRSISTKMPAGGAFSFVKSSLFSRMFKKSFLLKGTVVFFKFSYLDFFSALSFFRSNSELIPLLIINDGYVFSYNDANLAHLGAAKAFISNLPNFFLLVQSRGAFFGLKSTARFLSNLVNSRTI
jgi:hypothetical protein